MCVRSRCTLAGPRLLRDDAGNGGSLEKGRIVAGRAFVHFWRAFTWNAVRALVALTPSLLSSHRCPCL